MNEKFRQDLNVNTATREELISVPGIGPRLAERIEGQRPYLDETDLLEVEGIGPVLLDRIRPMLSFSSVGEELQEIDASKAELDEEPSVPMELVSGEEIGEESPAGTANDKMSAVVLGEDEELSMINSVDELEENVEGSEISAETVSGELTEPFREEVTEPLEQTAAEQVDSKGISRSTMAWLLAGTSFVSVIASVLATLLVLVLINGTLRIDRHEGVLLLNQQVQNLSGDLDILAGDLDIVNEKLTALEGLSGRMTTVEGEITTIQGQVDQAAEDVLEIQSAVQVLNETTSQLSLRLGQYDTFFEGLQDLIGALFGRPVPEAE